MSFLQAEFQNMTLMPTVLPFPRPVFFPFYLPVFESLHTLIASNMLQRDS